MYNVLGRKHIPASKKKYDSKWLDGVRLWKDLLVQLCNVTPGKRAGILKAPEAQQFAGWWRSANEGFKSGNGKIRDGYVHSAQEVAPSN